MRPSSSPKKVNVLHRMSFIDYSKFFAIALICIGHFLPIGSSLKVVLYSFHVPVFFVISGFLFKSEISSYFEYFKKLLFRIVLPYCCFFLISLIYYPLNGSEISLKQLCDAFIFKNGVTIWNSPLWFLPVMLFSSLLFSAVIKLFSSSKKIQFFIITALGILCFLFTAFTYGSVSELNFFGFYKVIHMLGYQCVGFLLRRMYEKLRINSFDFKRKLLVSLVSLALFRAFVFVALVFNKGDNLSVYLCDYNNIFTYIPLAVVGSVSFILIFSVLPECRVIAALAENTLFIMGIHYFFLIVWQKFTSRNIWLDFVGGCITVILLSAFCLLYRCLKSKTIVSKTAGFAACFGLF